MHELSIVASVVESVTESLEAYPNTRVVEVRLRVGALASVVVDSLEFCWGLATEGTPLEGSRLVVKTLPVVMHCTSCAADVTCVKGANWILSPSKSRTKQKWKRLAQRRLRGRHDEDCGAAAGDS